MGPRLDSEAGVAGVTAAAAAVGLVVAVLAVVQLAVPRAIADGLVCAVRSTFGLGGACGAATPGTGAKDPLLHRVQQAKGDPAPRPEPPSHAELLACYQ